jgi:predicted TIM-barrel fold metal-dependent hydrolase
VDHPIISADGHIDFPLLPETLWIDGAPASLRDRMPRVVDSRNGRVWKTPDGASFGLAGGMGSAGRPYIPGEIHRSDRMAETGLYEDQARGIMRPADPHLRIADQDRDGVSGEVVYGILGAVGRLSDAEVARTVTHIYNGWIAEFQRQAPDRFAGIGCLSSAVPVAAASELRRCGKLGLKGAELGMTHDMLPLWHEDWEPVWEASAASGVPVHIHTVGPAPELEWAQNPATYRRWLATHISGFQIPMMKILAALIFGGALERHPAMKVVIGESGIGWLPYALERFDLEWEDQFQDLIPKPPSEYWRRQMYATFQVDRTGLRNLEAIGPETVMWGSDFPHPDGTWPDSRELLAAQLGDLSAETQRLILFENAANLYGFPQGT